MSKQRPNDKTRRPKPPPRCKTILICERTIIEAGSGSVSLIAAFDRFELHQFPSHSRAFEIYLVLVDGIGRYDVVVEIYDLRDGTILGRLPPIKIEWPERLARMTVIIPIAPIPLDHAGEYDIVVFGNGQEIDRLKFSAVELGEERDAAGEED